MLNPRRFLPSLDWLLVILMLVAYTAVFSSLAFRNHEGMRTAQADLGQIDQAVWNSAHGHWLEFTKDDFQSTRLTDHVEPIFVLISPLFWLWNDVRALLLFQVLAVALGAIPLYALARQRPGKVGGLALVLAYFLHPSLQSAVLTEFHAIPLTVPLILWAFWAGWHGKWRAFAVALLLLTAVKEEAALLAAGIAAWVAIRTWLSAPAGKRRQALRGAGFLIPLSLSAVAVLWFAIATFVIVPAHAVDVYGSDQSVYFQRYGPLGNTPLDIFTSFFTRPGQVWAIASEPPRLHYLWLLIATFGGLPLLGLDVLVFGLPLLLANLLSTYPAQYYGEFHYSAPLVPFFAVAAWLGWRRLAGKVPRLAPLAGLALVVGALALYGAAGRGPLGGRYDPPPVTAHHRLLQRFLAQIPDDAPVTATAAVHPHISHRRVAYKFPHGQEADIPATWALLDVTGESDMAPGDLQQTVFAMLAAGWGVEDAADGFLLLRRGAERKDIPPVFYDFVRIPGVPQQDDPLRFVGLGVADWPAWRQTQVISRWQVGANYVPGSIRPWLELRDLAGQRLYTHDDLTPPALLWYPPSRWQPGDRITITTLPLSLPRWTSAFVAAVHGPDPNLPQHRLPTDLFMSGTYLPTVDGTQALVGLLQRKPDDILQRLPLAEWDVALSGLPGQQQASGQFHSNDGQPLPVQVWLPQRAAAGSSLLVISRWRQPLPAGVVAFVHLRQNGNIVAQQDGPLQISLPLAERDPLLDIRQLAIPADIAAGTTLDLVLGLYHSDSGQRLPASDARGEPRGDELALGSLIVTPPPIPDQTCALIPATCAAQPMPD